MAVHVNSLAAYHSLNLGERAAQVLAVYVESLQPLTDREVMERLGFTDPNAVRPRVTDLVDAKLLEECGSDTGGGRKVRVCRPTTFTLTTVGTAKVTQTNRRAICAYIAKMEGQGATEADLARALPTIHVAHLPLRVKECWGHGLITQELGEVRADMVAWHITAKGAELLKLPAGSWHSDRRVAV